MLIKGSRDEDRLTGTLDDDIFRGFGGNDFIRGRGGDDLIFGHSGNDVIFGGNGDDEVRGGNGDDEVRGNNGNDFVNGGNGNDLVFGGNGDDTVIGGDGADIIRGGNGDDVLVSVGSGEDISRIDTSRIAANEDQGGGVASLRVQTQNDDQFSLFLVDDGIISSDRNEVVEGNIIIASRENENDTMLNVADILIGGAGSDMFVVGAEVTAILDFTPGEDQIRADGFDVALTQVIAIPPDPSVPPFNPPALVENGYGAAVAFTNTETGQLLLVGSSAATTDQIIDAVVVADIA